MDWITLAQDADRLWLRQ